MSLALYNGLFFLFCRSDADVSVPTSYSNPCTYFSIYDTVHHNKRLYNRNPVLGENITWN